ncbi:hypothetical protein ACQ4PT_021083 [Festuca glaucescens]
MDPTLNQEWTSSEVEEARSLIATLESNKIIYDDNDDNNKKHNDIVDALHALFPSKTMQQVTDLYVDLVVEMHLMQWREAIPITGGTTHNIWTVHDLVNGNFGESGESGASGTHGVFTMGDLVNGYNFGLQEEASTMEMEEALPMVENNTMEVLENNIVSDQPIAAPHPGRFWTTDEHRLFLRGLRVYGRGDWKNISRYFVTTKTAIQVSSHAQKYFKRLEKRALSGRAGRQRFSINDVGLHDDDPWEAENSFASRQALASTGLNNDPSFGSRAPASPVMMNSLAQFWPPIIYNQQVAQQPVWSEQQMMGSSTALMEGTGNSLPACQQGSAYLPPGQCMNMM